MKEFRKEIEFLLAKNEFNLALDRIQAVIENDDRLNKDFVILKSKLTEVNEREMQGTLDYESARMQKNRAIQGLIELTREITEEEYISFIEKSDIVLKLKGKNRVLQGELTSTKESLVKIQDESIKQKSEIAELKTKLKESIATNKYLESELNQVVPKIFTDECKKCEGNGKIQLKYRNDEHFIYLYNSVRNFFISDKNKHKGFTFFDINCPYCKDREVSEEDNSEFLSAQPKVQPTDPTHGGQEGVPAIAKRSKKIKNNPKR